MRHRSIHPYRRTARARAAARPLDARPLILGALALLVLGLLAMIRPAAAQDVPPVMDEVVLTLMVEDWVETDTARVTVAVNATVMDQNAGNLRDEMLTAVGALAEGDDIEWRFTQFNRNQDRSGLERWSAQLEARLPEAQLGGINERAEAQSRPGLNLRIQNIDFSPTLEEFEAIRAELRARIYAEAMAELERLKRAVPDRDWRIATVDFVNELRPAMTAMRGMMRESAVFDMAEQAAAPSAGGLAVSQKIVQRASIRLAVFAEED